MTSKIVVNNIEADSGVSTVTFNSNVVRGGSNLHSTGLALGAGSTVGAVTGVTTYYGDGSQLTGITQTTINNNADNRVITGSGTANRLEGESNLSFNGTNLLTVHVPSATGEPAINFTNSDTGTGTGNGFGLGLNSSESPYIWNRENSDLRIATNNTERMRINAAGNVGINQTSPSDKLHVVGTTNFTGNSYIGGDLYMYGGSYSKGIFLGGSGSANKLDDYEYGTWTPVIKKYVSGSWANASMAAAGSNASYYIKIGEVVNIVISWSGFQVSDSSYCVIGGLPFSSTSNGHFDVNYTVAFNSHQNQGGHIGSGSDLIQFYHTANNWNAFNNNTANLYIHGGGFYRAS